MIVIPFGHIQEVIDPRIGISLALTPSTFLFPQPVNANTLPDYFFRYT
jgi:hypothetical protein